MDSTREPSDFAVDAAQQIRALNHATLAPHEGESTQMSHAEITVALTNAGTLIRQAADELSKAHSSLGHLGERLEGGVRR